MDRRARLRVTAGFTLIELVLVIVLIVIISGLSVGRMDSVLIWKQQGDIRKFADTWEFLYNEATSRGNAYRLIIDITKGVYAVRREVRAEGNTAKSVDYLSGFRSDKSKPPFRDELKEELNSLDEEFAKEDERQSGHLETLFFDTVFGDSNGPTRLTVPLEYPSLAEQKPLTDGLVFEDVKTVSGKHSSGIVELRFSSMGATDFAVVHLRAGETPFTVFMNPSTGKVSIEAGSLDFNWTLK